MRQRARILLALFALGACGADSPKSVIDLQPFRRTDCISIKSKDGKQGSATLINLNPAISSWYVLQVAWGGSSPTTYHLQNPAPRIQRMELEETDPFGVVVRSGKDRYSCDLFEADELARARSSPLIYAPLCDGRVYLRNPAVGHRTTLETATEFLRDHIWGGEKIIALGHVALGDAHRETGSIESNIQGGSAAKAGEGQPERALVDPKYSDRLLTSANLGIALGGPEKSGMAPGAWYPASGNPGVYASIIQPNLIDSSILQSRATSVSSLDGVESSAMVYLVAFDLDRFDLGYALGTEHPKVAWSSHMLANMRDDTALPGPDGIGTIAPLISTGLVSPWDAPKTIATFTGGFKREHGAFKYGDLALKNQGSHYGFIEQGVVFSKLQPGLSSIFVLEDGSVGMKTWTEANNKLLGTMKYARQNGVPLIESGVPGELVNRWGPGNWSGSEDMRLRTMRSGAGIQSRGAKRFLIYAVFSSATPSAMARVFQAYRCDYAMLLDMNALEHTYMALYRRSEGQLHVDHLVKGMSELDKTVGGQIVPRFLGYADNRDFFYVTRKEITQ